MWNCCRMSSLFDWWISRKRQLAVLFYVQNQQAMVLAECLTPRVSPQLYAMIIPRWKHCLYQTFSRTWNTSSDKNAVTNSVGMKYLVQKRGPLMECQMMTMHASLSCHRKRSSLGTIWICICLCTKPMRFIGSQIIFSFAIYIVSSVLWLMHGRLPYCLLLWWCVA